MIGIYRWKALERWDNFTIPQLAVTRGLSHVKLSELLISRNERVDRSENQFSTLQPISIHFDGSISKRSVPEGREYSLSLLWAQPGDVVLSKIDLKNGAVAVVPDGWEKVVVTTHFKVYKPDTNRLNPDYFRLLIQTASFKAWLWANRTGADGRTEVKLNVFESLEIPLPSIEMQNTLFADYSAALKGAANLESDADRLEAEAIQAFESELGVTPPPPLPEQPVFIARFRDVERWSHEGIMRSTAEHRSEKPSLWTLIPIGEIGKVSYGLQKCPQNRPGAHSRPYLRVANVQRGVLDLREIKYINVPDEDMPKYQLQAGDILLCEGNSAELVGRGAIWRGEIENCVHQNHILRVRIDPNIALPEFVLAVMNSTYGQNYFRAKAKRTTNLASINSREVAGMEIPLPPVDIQRSLFTQLVSGSQKAKCLRDEAAIKRMSAWEAFESALFE